MVVGDDIKRRIGIYKMGYKDLSLNSIIKIRPSMGFKEIEEILYEYFHRDHNAGISREYSRLCACMITGKLSYRTKSNCNDVTNVIGIGLNNTNDMVILLDEDKFYPYPIIRYRMYVLIDDTCMNGKTIKPSQYIDTTDGMANGLMKRYLEERKALQTYRNCMITDYDRKGLSDEEAFYRNNRIEKAVMKNGDIIAIPV